MRIRPAAEEIEQLALGDLHRAATPELRAELGIVGENIGGVFVSLAPALPSSAIVINRTIGLGLTSATSNQAIGEIVDRYREAGVKRYFIHRHPDAKPDDIGLWLQGSGLEKARGWQKFARGREPVASTADRNICEIGTPQGADSATILSDAFDLGDVSRPWLAQLPGQDKWHVFVEYDGDAPMATGSIYIDGDTAWTDFGATAPDYRRKGCQLALLNHRIEFALDHGCQQIFTCTGEDVPGDPQHSYSNILRAGFKETYVRENFAPPRA